MSGATGVGASQIPHQAGPPSIGETRDPNAYINSLLSEAQGHSTPADSFEHSGGGQSGHGGEEKPSTTGSSLVKGIAAIGAGALAFRFGKGKIPPGAKNYVDDVAKAAKGQVQKLQDGIRGILGGGKKPGKPTVAVANKSGRVVNDAPKPSGPLVTANKSGQVTSAAPQSAGKLLGPDGNPIG